MPQPVAAPSPYPQAQSAIVRGWPHCLARSLPRPMGGDPNQALLDRIEVAA